MAIEQTRYIDIKSGVVNASITERNLQGLVFTAEDMSSGADADIKAAYDAGTPVRLTSNQVRSSFASSTKVSSFATKYFSYISPDGSGPTTLTVAKMLKVESSVETPAEAFARVDSITNDFGSFTFMEEPVEPYTIAQLQAVASDNSSKNFKYLFCIGFEKGDERLSSFKTGFSSYSGTCVVQGTDTYAAAIPMAISAAVDYNKAGSTVCMMFKQVGGEIASVETGTEADELDAAFVNYYGKTQTNGQQLSFYQRGFNSDGVDTAVYFNELWLKSRIATEFLNTMTSVNKIPADRNGRSIVESIVLGAAVAAFRNGTITIKESLTPAQIASIYQLSGGDDNAANDVLANGYWLDVVIEPIGTSSSEYKAVYTLIYSKGDAIRFVQGYHELV